MRKLLFILILLPLLATEPFPPPDSPYLPESDFPDMHEGGSTCGREITCLDGAKVSCTGPAGQCYYELGECNHKREHFKGWVQCGDTASKEYCNSYRCPP